MQKKNLSALSMLALTIASPMSLAQTDETGFSVETDLGIAHDDNIYRVTDELAVSDTFVSLAPTLKLAGAWGKHRFETSYSGDYAKFSEESDADYADHDIKARINLEHTLRLSTRFEAGFQKEHEDPGSFNRIQLDLQEYNKFEQTFFAGRFAYGSDSAIGQLTVSYRYTDKNYTNNNLDFLDFESNQLGARFTYRVAPKTRAYIDLAQTDFDYDPIGNFELDNKFSNYRAGISWNFTNKLTGDANMGYQERDYDLPAVRDISGLAYDGRITWSINSFTTVAFNARRQSLDSTIEGLGGFLRTTYGSSLRHDLTPLLHLNASARYNDDELVFNSERNDKRYIYAVGLEYDLSRLVSLSLDYKYDERDSTDPLADFEANTVSLTAKFTLD